METHEILLKLKNNELSLEDAELMLRKQPFEEMGYAKIDTHRKIRSGFSEVIFCSGKMTSTFFVFLENFMKRTERFLEQEPQNINMK